MFPWDACEQGIRTIGFSCPVDICVFLKYLKALERFVFKKHILQLCIRTLGLGSPPSTHLQCLLGESGITGIVWWLLLETCILIFS